MDRLGRRGRGGGGDLPVCRGARGLYRLESVLYAGSGSCVFLAEHLERSRRVAIKVPLHRPNHPGSTDRRIADEERARFQNEIQVLRSLRHPNIISVLDTGRIGSQPFYVMDHATRGSLGQQLRQSGPFPAPAAVRHALEVLDALAYAHRRGVVHRDVKPDNIVVDENGVARLVDFGIALVSSRPALSFYGENVGTPAYIAPEQVDDPSRAGPAADLFGLGATLYAIVTGSDPIGLLSTPHRDEALATVPPALVQVLDIATRPFVEERFADARTMALALADTLSVLEV